MIPGRSAFVRALNDDIIACTGSVLDLLVCQVLGVLGDSFWVVKMAEPNKIAEDKNIEEFVPKLIELFGEEITENFQSK